MHHWIVIPLLFATLALAAQPTKRPTDEERGRELYNRHCIQCHGPLALGDGPATKALLQPVPNVQGSVKIDEATLRILLRGSGLMPAFDGSFDKYDGRRVLRYMAGLGQAKPDETSEQDKQEVEEEVPIDDVGNAPPVDEEEIPAPVTP